MVEPRKIVRGLFLSVLLLLVASFCVGCGQAKPDAVDAEKILGGCLGDWYKIESFEKTDGILAGNQYRLDFSAQIKWLRDPSVDLKNVTEELGRHKDSDRESRDLLLRLCSLTDYTNKIQFLLPKIYRGKSKEIYELKVGDSFLVGGSVVFVCSERGWTGEIEGDMSDIQGHRCP